MALDKDKIEALKKQIADMKAENEAKANEKAELESLIKEGKELGIDVAAFEEDLKKLSSVVESEQKQEEEEKKVEKQNSNNSITHEDLTKFKDELKNSIAEAIKTEAKPEVKEEVDTIYG